MFMKCGLLPTSGFWHILGWVVASLIFQFDSLFLKLFLKGQILQTGKGGKLDFYHNFAVLTKFLKR